MEESRFKINEKKELIVDMTKVDKVIIVQDDEEIEITEELIDLVKLSAPVLVSVVESISDMFKGLADSLAKALNTNDEEE